MRYYHISNGCTAEQAAAIRAAGISTEAAEADRSTFVHLANGSVLHRMGCPKVAGKETVVVHHSLVSVAGHSTHSMCTRYQSTWGNGTIRHVMTLLQTAHIVTQTEALKARKEPAFALLSELLQDIRTEDASDAFQVAYGDTERYDQILKDLLELQEAWKGSGSPERAAACVVRALQCPRSSLKHLGAGHDKAWRLAAAGWVKWQEAVAAEKPLEEAHTAAEKAIHAAARRMARSGEDVQPGDTSGIRALTRSWERTLKAAASAAEGEVLLVARGGYHLLPGRSPVGAAAAAFPSAKNLSAGTVALRCPTQVADWLADPRGGWEARNIHVLGAATEQDTTAVLETIVAVWDSAARGKASSPHEALKAARTLAG